MSYEDEAEKSKCAEIFRNVDGLYSFVCYDCGKEYQSSDAIIKHIEVTHNPIEDFDFDSVNVDGYKTETLDMDDAGFLPESPQTTVDYQDDDYDEVKSETGCDSMDNNDETDSAYNKMLYTATADTILKQNDQPKLQISVLHKPLYECDICGKKFTTKTEIRRHLACKDHGDAMQSLVHRCNGCDRPFTSIGRLENHRKRELGKSASNEAPHCKLCNETFAMHCEYKHHIQVMHQDDRTSTCLICDKSFPMQAGLLRHMRTVHMDNGGGGGMECDICHAIIRGGKGNLNQHRQTRHSDRRPFECSVCKKTFKFACYVRLHMRFHEKQKHHQCSLCGKTFYTVAVLNEHIKSHTNARRFKCSQCYKKFMTEQNLQKHYAETHTVIRLVPCALCGKEFRSQKTLKQHLALHSEVKRYQCQYCELRFAQLAGQRSHEKHRHKSIVL